MGHSILLINNLEIKTIFKNKAREKGVGIIDLINRLIQVLKKDLERLAISTQNTGLIELVKPWNKG